jgi:Sulfotransferase family
MPVKSDLMGSAAARPQTADHLSATAGRPTAPVVILSYPYSGAGLVQQALADGTDLACTTATGILPLCEVAAASWAKIDDRPGQAMSRLAISSIRGMVSAQLAMILAATAGKRRWCELASSVADAAETFLQIFPAARFVCVHRACTDVISAAIAVQPWGLADPAMSQFAICYPRNSVAAVAGYWALATEQLLTFEVANPQATNRVRYEDVVADAAHALKSVRSSLYLNQQTHQQPLPGVPGRAGLIGEGQEGAHLQVPVDMIPPGLRKRIDDLHAELGYPPVRQTVELHEGQPQLAVRHY